MYLKKICNLPVVRTDNASEPLVVNLAVKKSSAATATELPVLASLPTVKPSPELISVITSVAST